MKLNCTGLSLLLLACNPADPVTTETDSGSDSNSTTSGDASTTAPTTGAGACTPPDGDVLDVLLLADGTLVVRPGSLACGGAPRSCDCVKEALDRLVLELGVIAEGTYDFVEPSDATVRVQCSMGDDGCAETPVAGSVTITRANGDCVAGRVNFGATAFGTFAVQPCPG